MLELLLLGKPVAQARPRLSRNGVFNPQSKEKRQMQAQLVKQMQFKRISKPLKGPIWLNMTFHTSIPRSWSQKRKEAENGKWNMKRPDIDNFLKFALDTLNGLIYLDDAQVVELTCQKIYSKLPRTEIQIKELI